MSCKFTCLAIDMGAGSIRGILGRFDNKLTLSEVFRFDNKIIEKDGFERWNLDAIHKGISEGVRKALEVEAGKIDSIAADSWGVDFVLLGGDGLPIEYPVSYRDNRTIGMPEKWVSEFMSKSETFRLSGINFYPFNTLFQLLAMKDAPVWKNTEKALFMSNYVNYYLGGEAVNELSLASTSQIVNIATLDFDKSMAQKLNLNVSLFGKLKERGCVIGKLKPEFGVGNDVKICAVQSHDTASAIESVPAKNQHFAFISTGTWCIVGMISEKAVTSDVALEKGITNEVSSRGKIKVSKNIMGLWLVQKLREVLMPDVPFGEIDKMAMECNYSGMLIDPDDSRLYNPDNMRDVFDILVAESGNRKFSSDAEYFRCAYESLAVSFKSTIEVLEKMHGSKLETVHIIGGGAQSSVLCQLTANATGLPVVAGPVEGAAIGNILWQARACGYINSDAEAADWVNRSFDVRLYNPKV